MSVARFVADQRPLYRVPVAFTAALFGVSVSRFPGPPPRLKASAGRVVLVEAQHGTRSDPDPGTRVGWPEGFSPSGSHGSRRDSLLSPGSYHPGHQAVQTHLQCVNSVGEARVNPANCCREARMPASRRYSLRIQRTR